jgi:hypothetical protein
LKSYWLIAAAMVATVSGTSAQQAPDDGGPDYYKVEGIKEKDALNIRLKPSSKSKIVGRVGNGAVLKNGGCARYNGARWCKVTVFNSDVSGWAFGKFLREGAAPVGDAKVAGTPYNATGSMNCVPAAGAPQTQCKFGVIRSDNGRALIEITLPTGGKRKLWFEQGKPVASDFGLRTDPGTAIDEKIITLPSGEAYTVVDVFVTGD